MRREEPDRREVHRARREEPEDDREAAGRPRDLDPVVRLVLGEGERVAAVREERGVAAAQVHVARVELGEVSHEKGRVPVLALREGLDASDELGVGELTQRLEKVRPIPRLALCHRGSSTPEPMLRAGPDRSGPVSESAS
jgi:hypothetical protein